MTTMNNEDPADPGAMPLPDATAWRVYFPDEQREEFASSLDDLLDDLTNCAHDEPEPLYTADQMREAVAAERERSDELAAMRLLVRELRGRLERVKSEPQDTMSDSKAVSAMVRHAKLGLQAIERLDRAAEREQPK